MKPLNPLKQIEAGELVVLVKYDCFAPNNFGDVGFSTLINNIVSELFCKINKKFMMSYHINWQMYNEPGYRSLASSLVII